MLSTSPVRAARVAQAAPRRRTRADDSAAIGVTFPYGRHLTRTPFTQGDDAGPAAARKLHRDYMTGESLPRADFQALWGFWCPCGCRAPGNAASAGTVASPDSPARSPGQDQ